MPKKYQIKRWENRDADILAMRIGEIGIPIKDYKISGTGTGNVELQVTILATEDEIIIEPRQAFS